MNILKKYPFHTFLIIPYLCIFLYSNNTDILEFTMLLRSLLVGLFITILFFIPTFFFMKKSITKTGTFVTCLLTILFCYGIIYDWLEVLYWNNLWPFKNIHRYLIFTYFILIIALFFFVKYSKYEFLKLNFVLNNVILILIIFNLLRTVIKSEENISNNPQISYNISINPEKSIIQKPDIYYIILDGYASNKILKKYFNYSNSEFSDFLISKNFYIAENSKANYYSTIPSLSATLSLNYHFQTDTLTMMTKLKNNIVFNFLKKNGYKIYHIRSGYTVSNIFYNTDESINIDGLNEFERAMLRFSILRIDDLFGYIPYFRIKSQFKKLSNLINTDTITPKFVFTHIVCPHPPYIFDRYGNKVIQNSFGDNSWEPRTAYLEQLMFINQKIKQIINEIFDKYNNTNPKPIIIIQSDHGPYISTNNLSSIFEARSHIFNAIYPNNLDYLYDSISSVNTFRLVFKNLFSDKIELLKDSFPDKEKFYYSPIVRKNLLNSDM